MVLPRRCISRRLLVDDVDGVTDDGENALLSTASSIHEDESDEPTAAGASEIPGMIDAVSAGPTQPMSEEVATSGPTVEENDADENGNDDNGESTDDDDDQSDKGEEEEEEEEAVDEEIYETLPPTTMPTTITPTT